MRDGLTASAAVCTSLSYVCVCDRTWLFRLRAVELTSTFDAEWACILVLVDLCRTAGVIDTAAAGAVTDLLGELHAERHMWAAAFMPSRFRTLYVFTSNFAESENSALQRADRLTLASDLEHVMASIRKVHVRRQQLAVARAARGDFRRTNIETSSHAPACLKQVFAACVREIAITMLGQWNKARNMEMNVLNDSTVEVWCVARTPSTPADEYDSGGDGGGPSVVGSINTSTRKTSTGTSSGSGTGGGGGGGGDAPRAVAAHRSKPPAVVLRAMAADTSAYKPGEPRCGLRFRPVAGGTFDAPWRFFYQSACEYSGDVILQAGRWRCRNCTTASGESAPCRFVREYGEFSCFCLNDCSPHIDGCCGGGCCCCCCCCFCLWRW
jgi:hypothetical protein